VTRVHPTRWADHVAAWIAADKCGTMDYLVRDLALRLDPARIQPGLKSIILVADLYEKRGHPNTAPLPPGHARVARYAQGADYHPTVKKRLYALSDALRERFKSAQFKSFTDTVPLFEREHAEHAGLGWVGKNTMLIHPRLGSNFVLGGVLTTLELDPPDEQSRIADACGTCTRCIDACPTRAITPYSVDASRCISYLTIEREKPIAPEFHAAIGEWIYGCDICQDVCPHNSERPEGTDIGTPNAAYSPLRRSFDALSILGWIEDDRQREFDGSPMKRATLAMMKRNAMIVAANTLPPDQLTALASRLRSIQTDRNESEHVRATAQQVAASIHAKLAGSTTAPAAPPPAQG